MATTTTVAPVSPRARRREHACIVVCLRLLHVHRCAITPIHHRAEVDAIDRNSTEAFNMRVGAINKLVVLLLDQGSLWTRWQSAVCTARAVAERESDSATVRDELM